MSLYKFLFADGALFTAAQISDKAVLWGTDADESISAHQGYRTSVFGYGGNDFISGSSANDILNGGTGNDTLEGGNGNDTYVYNSKDGQDVITDTGGTDTLRFGDGITKDDIALFIQNSNLFIGVADEGKISTINSQSMSDAGIEIIKLSDDSFLSSTDINTIIQDMAAFSKDHGISISSVDDVKKNQELMNIIVHSWHKSE
ncbi:MAG: hypothetical protein HQK79_19160 [Desulfobacterales bacterium]|nr:hypothetical protein [Desulfobacterales bacterium]